MKYEKLSVQFESRGRSLTSVKSEDLVLDKILLAERRVLEAELSSIKTESDRQSNLNHIESSNWIWLQVQEVNPRGIWCQLWVNTSSIHENVTVIILFIHECRILTWVVTCPLMCRHLAQDPSVMQHLSCHQDRVVLRSVRNHNGRHQMQSIWFFWLVPPENLDNNNILTWASQVYFHYYCTNMQRNQPPGARVSWDDQHDSPRARFQWDNEHDPLGVRFQ